MKLRTLSIIGMMGLSMGCRTVGTIPNASTYRMEERKKIDKSLQSGANIFSIELSNYEGADLSHRRFIDFFISQIFPKMKILNELSFQSSWYSLAIDRALYSSESEKKSWETKKISAEQDMNSIVNGDEWKMLIKNWAELAVDLKGPLADEARSMKRRLDIQAYETKVIPILNEVVELQTQIDNAANNSPFAANLSETAKEIGHIKERYSKKKISLAEAASQIQEQRNRGERGQSQDIAMRANLSLNRSAILRTELAKSKGFKSWSAFRVHVQAEPYTEPFTTVNGRVEFLESILKETDEILKILLQALSLRDPSVDRADLTESHLSLLLPDSDDFGRYFPREKVDQIWAETILASGFSAKVLDQITRDVYPRENKYTHAYMNFLRPLMPKRIKLDAKSLEVRLPESDKNEEWTPSEIAILQNFFSDAMDSVRVALHEGGHAQKYTEEVNIFGRPQAYAYEEVHSISMEYFAFDREFLKHFASDRSGHHPSDQEIDSYILNAKLQEFLQFRILVARALYELKLWDYEYTEKSETFVDRSVSLYGEIIPRATGVKGAENHGVDFTGRGPFNAPHFRSGWVEYIGYVLASIAAYQTYEKLLSLSHTNSGRSSLWNQPHIADTLIKGYYRNGFKMAFPKSVEKFTGKTFNFVDFKKYLEDAIHSFAKNPAGSNCRSLLEKCGK